MPLYVQEAWGLFGESFYLNEGVRLPEFTEKLESHTAFHLCPVIPQDEARERLTFPHVSGDTTPNTDTIICTHLHLVRTSAKRQASS